MSGGAKGTWTLDPLHAMQVLSQLSYNPENVGNYNTVFTTVKA